MMLTGGIELAEGKSNLAEPGVPGVCRTNGMAAEAGPAPVVPNGGTEANVAAPAPEEVQASA
jgi:hypothetical protein